MNWNKYFYNHFPQDLRSFNSSRENRDCPHHQITQHLAWFVDEHKKYNFGPEFYMSWFGLTMIDQVLNKYFPDSFLKWKMKFGEHPVPMRGAGMGCISWDIPIWLIEIYVDLDSEELEKEFHSFLGFLLTLTKLEFNDISLSLEDFLLAALQDKRLLNRNSSASEILRNRFKSEISLIGTNIKS